MASRGLIILATFAWTGASSAAELPSRQAKSKPVDPRAHECVIDGERGVALPGGGCVRMSGYVSVGVTGGNIKH